MVYDGYIRIQIRGPYHTRGPEDRCPCVRTPSITPQVLYLGLDVTPSNVTWNDRLTAPVPQEATRESFPDGLTDITRVVVMVWWEKAMRVHMVLANNIHHGSCRPLRISTHDSPQKEAPQFLGRALKLHMWYLHMCLQI